MKKGRCIHFNGIGRDTCRAGVSYLDVCAPLTQSNIDWHNKNYPNQDGVELTAMTKRMPCEEENGVSLCPSCEFPTEQQLAESEAELQRYMNQLRNELIIVRPLIKKDIEARNSVNRSFRAAIDCPICDDGTLSYQYAGAYNKHIWARCNTNDCVNWME